MTFFDHIPSLILLSVFLTGFNILTIKYFSEDEIISRMFMFVIALITTACVVLISRYSTRPIADVIFMTLLIVTGGIDVKTKTIVTGITIIGGVLAAGVSLFYGKPAFDLLAGGFIGFMVYLIIYVLAKAYYKKEAFGFGDVIFMGATGLYLGVWHGLLSGFLTFYIALIGVVALKIIGKLLSRQTEVAFAPYMAISAGIVSLFGNDLVALYVKLFLPG